MGDAELVARAVDGDRDAFAALYDRHARAVHDFLRRMLRDPHDAADALQDTFLAAGTRLHQLRDPSRFRAWLFAIARRNAYAATAARNRTDPLPDGEMSPDAVSDLRTVDVDPTDGLADEELRSLVDAAAEGLDERDRAVLHLHFRLGLGGDELAGALGVERGNAHVLVHRVRDRLQRSMGALLVARHGRAACPELASLLGAWDGQLSTVLRKRVGRHADGCDACGATRESRLRPSALLGVVPLAPIAAGARELVLRDVELCSFTGEPWPGPDGFPPGDDRPVTDGRRRASRTLVTALVALLVVLLAGSVVLADADPVDRGVPPPGADSTSTSRVERSTTTRPGASSTSSTAPGAPTASTDTTSAPRPGVTPTTRRPRPATTTTTEPAGPTTTAPTPTTEPPTTPTTAEPSTTTTARPRTTTTTTRPARTTTSTTSPNGPPVGQGG